MLDSDLFKQHTTFGIYVHAVRLREVDTSPILEALLRRGAGHSANVSMLQPSSMAVRSKALACSLQTYTILFVKSALLLPRLTQHLTHGHTYHWWWTGMRT